MAIKKFKPTTPSLREMAVESFSEKDNQAKPLRNLMKSKKRTAGRNAHGRITSRRRGGGAKKQYRIIDFKRNKLEVPAKVTALEYDPNRTCRIAQLCYKDGYKNYIIAPLGIEIGDEIVSSASADIKAGNSKLLKEIPIGTIIHNIELYPGSGGQIARSAGSYVQLMAKENGEALLRMPSGELRKVKDNCRATIGQVSNSEHENRNIGKAGKNRLRGRRPKVRGVVMNPVDHPHGGGEGRTSGGRHPVTPWGKPTKGYKTRRNKRTSINIVKRRKK
jgi:large subunit ribosomal protein L2